MRTITIKRKDNKKEIFSGKFNSLKQCVEAAVKEKICLDYADLRNTNLAHAMLDETVMRHADLSGANLINANATESLLQGTCFTGAALQNTYFSLSCLRECQFDEALFGATDITGADLTGSVFGSPSAFTLPFTLAETCALMSYRENGKRYPMSNPPIVINGLPYQTILMDEHIKIGNSVKSLREWRKHKPNTTKAQSPEWFIFKRLQAALESIAEDRRITPDFSITINC